jgi:hypothetical protein
MAKQKSKQPIIQLVKHGKIYWANDDETSEMLFNHLVAHTEHEYERITYIYDLVKFTRLAELHGWKVTVRKVRPDELDNGD